MSAFKKIALGHRLKAIAGAFLVHFRGDTEAQFTTIYRYGTWCIRGARIPRSGPHATVDTTVKVRQTLTHIITYYGIQTMLDAACGDMTWMPLVLDQHPELKYTGIDVVKELVKNHQQKFPGHRFYSTNLIEHVPDSYDMIHCREVLNHLKTKNVLRILENFNQSGSRYLLLNNAPGITRNLDLVLQNGMYRGINWRLPPYQLEPIQEWEQDVAGRTYVLMKLGNT